MFQDHPHLSGAPAIQRHPVRHARRRADGRLREVLGKGREGDQSEKERLGSGTKVLRVPTLGVRPNRREPAGHGHAG